MTQNSYLSIKTVPFMAEDGTVQANKHLIKAIPESCKSQAFQP